MHVTDLEALRSLQSDWGRVYAADPYAQPFISWPWVYGWASACPNCAVILSAHADDAGGPVAFCTLARRSCGTASAESTPLRLGGCALADYAGFLCQPGYESALIGFARYLREELDWPILQLDAVADPRVGQWVRHLEDEGCTVEPQSATPCPRVVLPTTWEGYQQACLGQRRRQVVNQKIRKLERMPNVRISIADADSVDADAAVVLNLWQQRWGERPAHELGVLRESLRRCSQQGLLLLAVMWQDDVPMAALAGYMDRTHRAFYNHIHAYDARFQSLSPGTVLLAHSIRWAIEQGMEVYDFLRGGDAYKYDWGAKDRLLPSYKVVRPSLRQWARRLCTGLVPRFQSHV